MADPKNDRPLARLCRAIDSGKDLPAVFLIAAREVHDRTGCAGVSLFLPASVLSLPRRYVVEFAGSTRVSELPAEDEPPSAVRWVLEHRQARIVRGRGEPEHPSPKASLAEMESQSALYLPLVCRGEAVGVLELAGGPEDPVEPWEQRIPGWLCTLLALAVDNFVVRARMADQQRFQRENAYLRDEIKTDRDLRLLTGESPGMKAVRLAVQQVARTDSTVLIFGETGTGKELVARAIHQLSRRRDHLLVTVNCAALAPGVIASELFGHEQGAFTGAVKRRLGRFELAHQGTLFLDEVGELPADTQVTLLRVLQERVIERVGCNEPVAVDVRVVAATHQDLEKAIGQGRFRADLFFRLNVFPIRVPPLRDRREDIPDLVRHFVLHFGRHMSKANVQVSRDVLELLMAYHWPGNVRELENLIERAMIVTTGEMLEVEPTWLRPAPVSVAAGEPGAGLAELERQAILEALERCRGKIYGPGGAAAVLRLKPTTLYGKMRKHQIARKPGLGADL